MKLCLTLYDKFLWKLKKIEIDSHLSWLKDQILFANTNCKLRCDSHLRCLLQCVTLHSMQPLRYCVFVCNQCKLPPCRLWGSWNEVSWYLLYARPRCQYGNRCCNFVSKVSLRKNHIIYHFTEICVIEISSVVVWVLNGSRIFMQWDLIYLLPPSPNFGIRWAKCSIIYISVNQKRKTWQTFSFGGWYASL